MNTISQQLYGQRHLSLMKVSAAATDLIEAKIMYPA